MITYSNEGVSMPKIKRRAITAWIKAVAASYNRKVGEVGYLFCNDEKIRHCPHGRPTMIAMTHRDLDKKFKRIV